MKQLITFSLLLSITMLNAQVISLTDYSMNKREIVGFYVKDMDNLLDPYVGDWIGEENGRKYLLRVAKVIGDTIVKRTDTRMDVLKVRYKVTNITTGNEVANILSLEDDNYLVIMGLYPGETLDYYEMYYMGKEADCGEEGTIMLSLNKNNKDEMAFLYFPTIEIWLVNACIDNKPTPLFPKKFLLNRR